MKLRMIVLFGAVAALAACGGPTWKATLSPATEVPAVTGSSGTGSVTVVQDGTKLDISGTYSGLSGPAKSAHIHGPADATMVSNPPKCALTFTEGTPAGSGTLAGECPTADPTVDVEVAKLKELISAGDRASGGDSRVGRHASRGDHGHDELALRRTTPTCGRAPAQEATASSDTLRAP